VLSPPPRTEHSRAAAVARDVCRLRRQTPRSGPLARPCRATAVGIHRSSDLAWSGSFCLNGQNNTAVPRRPPLARAAHAQLAGRPWLEQLPHCRPSLVNPEAPGPGRRGRRRLAGAAGTAGKRPTRISLVRPITSSRPLASRATALNSPRMTTRRRFIVRLVMALFSLLTGCAAQVRYTDPGRKLELNLKPADRAADMIE
jgi:hypothetical protein